MLKRITLGVAIVAALAIVALNAFTIRNKINTIVAEREHWHTEYNTTYATLTRTQGELKQTQTDLAQTKKTLEATTTERDRARTEAASMKKRATQLSAVLKKTQDTLSNVQADLAAYKATGFTPPQIMQLGKTLKQAEDNLAAIQQENHVLARKIDRMQYQLARYQGSNPPVYLPANLIGKIVVCDPKWDFVVLNIGADQGAKQYGEMLVNRDGQLVAKIIIRSVEKNRCIANVMPGWKLGQVMEGDQVTPAHPAQS